jgi:ABC-type metal ion transport system substrate-binding protein
MIRKTAIALAAALLAAAAAAPAFAATDNVFGTSDDYLQLNTAKAAVAQRLEQRGLDVTNVDEWDGYVRADVRLADGSLAARFFEPGSLKPVKVTDLD